MHPSSANLLRRPTLLPRPATRSVGLGLCLLLGLLAALPGCSSREFDAVKEYKVFLEKAKPALASMNKSREELYQLSDPDQMLPLFRDKLLVQVEELRQLARDQPPRQLGSLQCNLLGNKAADREA